MTADLFTATELPSFSDLYEFLRVRYKYDRFEGRNGLVWGEDTSRRITQGSMDQLRDCGFGCVSQHESITGSAVFFDRDLTIISDFPAWLESHNCYA
jgi:hypothetical protein